ncbi:MAG: hypothetical protein JEZ07_14025 [Phycisphaerae bacterium]|nr:hypothetical protein [Phycisphaerae bacterium]
MKNIISCFFRKRCFLLMVSVLLVVNPLWAEDSLNLLWQIGEADNDTAEFAFAPGDYRSYKRPGFFVVNQSAPRRDWPYVQPGTIDGGWAPGGAQTFDIVFGLDFQPEQPCRLTLDFVDVHSQDPPKLRIAINDFIVEKQMAPGAGDASVFGEPEKGKQQLAVIDIPAGHLKAGDNQISITTVSGSWVLWDAVLFQCPAGVKLADVKPHTSINSISAPAMLMWREDDKIQPVSLEVMHIGKACQVDIDIDGELTSVGLVSGYQQIQGYVNPVKQKRMVDVSIKRNGELLGQGTVELKPVRGWEIHIVHQTHLDIGFTHKQADVLRLQVEHLRTALKYIERTKDYPPEARHQWHPEGMWAVEEFMRIATKKEKKAFLEACRNQQIHLDVLYAQAMTGMYTDEELFELMSAAKRFQKKYDIPIVSAMQSDVPGYTWGLASALAHNGVEYLSVGPNWFSTGGMNDFYKGANIVGQTHRGGRVFEWADQPFWWVSPSGKHKVFFWMPGWGYSGFHGGRDTINEDKVMSYLHHLDEIGYPYDMVMWRYGIGADNGPPSMYLSNVVRDWNKKYVSPRLVITNNSEVMKNFANTYGDKIPVVSGDFSPYWEDGCASTSRATAVNRENSEKLSQLQTMWSMLDSTQNLHDRFDLAWNKAIMYDEHTWGAYNSISAPDSDFAIQQDKYKQEYADGSNKLANELQADITAKVIQQASNVIDVYNTSSWQRSSLILLSGQQSLAGDEIRDADGRVIASQRLASGQLAFIADNVPALGASRYSVHKGNARQAGAVKVDGLRMSNGLLTLRIDLKSGAIASLRHRDIDKELVDNQKASGLNDYLYIIGRDASKNRMGIEGPVKVTVEDAGPLVATLRIESDAPGCKKLIRRVRLCDGFDYVELINTTEKLRELKPEGLYFGFPFDIDNSVSRIDSPWAVVQVEKDQIRGANRNFYCVQRWVDVSNKDYGVTWVPVDAPMLQFDPIKIALPFGVQHFRQYIDPGSYIHSWTMNNHWECNYKAYQQGQITFRYALRPHAGGYDAVEAQHFGRGICRPMLAVQVDAQKPVVQPMFKLLGDGVVVTTIRPTRDGKDLLVRLFNTADKTAKTELKWEKQPKKIWLSNPMEDKLELMSGPFEMSRFQIITLRVSP